jgi:hypothetical protein
MPDSSWYNIPKRAKIYQNDQKVHIPHGHKIYLHLSLQDTPKIFPNWDFWFENIPSGNRALGCKKYCLTYITSIHTTFQSNLARNKELWLLCFS